MTRTHSHTSVHECLQTRSDISTCLYCLHREQEKKERKKEILLEYRAVKVVKNKKKYTSKKNRKCKKQTYTQTLCRKIVLNFKA